MTHQELLNDWVKARVYVIGESSGSIRLDCRRLEAQARRYAVENGLTPPTEEQCGIYYEDAEQDAEIQAQLAVEVQP